jgi:OOP family OmpA-OmpF porin
MKKLLLALIATTAVAGAAQAQTNAPRAYVGVGAATANNQTSDSYKTGGKIYGGYNVDQNNERKYDNGAGTHVNNYDTGLYGGVGVEYKLNENLAVNAEYERYGKDKAFGAKADVYTVGLKYGF